MWIESSWGRRRQNVVKVPRLYEHNAYNTPIINSSLSSIFLHNTCILFAAPITPKVQTVLNVITVYFLDFICTLNLFDLALYQLQLVTGIFSRPTETLGQGYSMFDPRRPNQWPRSCAYNVEKLYYIFKSFLFKIVIVNCLCSQNQLSSILSVHINCWN